jgi:glycosyltransferase involved in cell wall biosynthesis
MLKKPPLVSVVMSVYNGGLYLQEAIDSILSQRYNNFEFIIIDDGSSDHTESIILTNYDNRIRYFRNEVNKGLIYSLNFAIEQARGEFIARMDADDIATIDRIEQQIDFLISNPDHGICGTNYIQIDRNGKLISKVSLPLTNIDAQTFLFFGNCFCHSSMIIRASLIRLFQYRAEFLVCEDYDLWSRMAKKTKVANLPHFSILYRIHEQNISIQKKQTMHNGIVKINARFLNECGMNYTQEELTLHANFLQYNYLFYKEQTDIIALQLWLLKLIGHLEKSKEINKDLALKTILYKWISICFNVRNFKKLLINPFFQKFRIVYIRCMLKKMVQGIMYKRILDAY